jgi:hypothetical protein
MLSGSVLLVFLKAISPTVAIMSGTTLILGTILATFLDIMSNLDIVANLDIVSVWRDPIGLVVMTLSPLVSNLHRIFYPVNKLSNCASPVLNTTTSDLALGSSMHCTSINLVIIWIMNSSSHTEPSSYNNMVNVSNVNMYTSPSISTQENILPISSNQELFWSITMDLVAMLDGVPSVSSGVKSAATARLFSTWDMSSMIFTIELYLYSTRFYVATVNLSSAPSVSSVSST